MEAIDACVTSSDLGFGEKYEGKVRDTYVDGDKMVAVTTDRQSAFDRHLAYIPFKGAVLNQTSQWWFKQTEHIVPNAVVATPDPNVTVMRRCEVFPIEFVVRGYLTGSTSTSLWTHYKNGGAKLLRERTERRHGEESKIADEHRHADDEGEGTR